ncbi:MAG: hypothetical protein R6X12_04090 [bacterium]
MTRSDPAPDRPPAPEVVGIVVGHGGLPGALRAAAVSIVSDPGALEAVSNTSRQAEGLDDKLEAAAARHPGSTLLLFVDLYGSSCAHGGIKFRARHPGTAILCGVNLPMLVRFLHYRRRLGYDELVEFLRRTGSEEIRPAGID